MKLVLLGKGSTSYLFAVLIFCLQGVLNTRKRSRTLMHDPSAEVAWLFCNLIPTSLPHMSTRPQAWLKAQGVLEFSDQF